MNFDRRLIALIIAIFLNALGYGVTIPVLSLYAKGFTDNYTLVGAALSGFGLARLMLDMPAGKLADKVGRKPLIVWGFTVWGFAAFLSFMATNIFILFISNFLQGIGSALALTASIVFVGDIAPKTERGKYMSYYQAGFFGSFFGLFIGGFVAEAINYRTPFLVLSLLTFLSAILSSMAIQENLVPPSKQGYSPEKRSMKQVFWNRDFMLVNFAAITLELLLTGIKITLLPVYASETLILSLGNIGVLVSLGTLFNFIMVLFLAGKIIDKFGRKVPLLSGLLVGAVACYGFVLSFNFVSMCFFSSLLGVAMGILTPSLTTFTVDISHPETRGLYVGVYRTFYDFGGLIAPLMVGTAIDIFSLEFPFVLISGICFSMTILVGIFMRKRVLN